MIYILLSLQGSVKRNGSFRRKERKFVDSFRSKERRFVDSFKRKESRYVKHRAAEMPCRTCLTRRSEPSVRQNF